MTALPIEYGQQNGFAVFTLNRPQALGAMNTPLLDTLDALLDRTEADDALGFVLTGQGRAFCVGSDLKETGGEGAASRIARMHRLMLRMKAFPKFSVAAINGLTLGGGLELALGCDFRVIDPAAEIALPEIRLGLMPCYGATQLLPRMIGEARALDMMLSGDRVNADKALAWGLVDAIAAPGAVLDDALAFAAARAGNAPVAEAAIRKAVRASGDLSLEAGLAVEYAVAMEVAESAQALGGLTRFRDKQPT